MRRNGFTLMEIIIYMALSAVVLSALFLMFRSVEKDYEYTSSSYETSKALESAVRWIRADLEESALVSVQPHGLDPRVNPGVCMASARGGPLAEETYNITNFGAPAWTKLVYYTLVVPPGDRFSKVRNLVRFERDQTGSPPTDTTAPEVYLGTPQAKRFRVIARHLLASLDGFSVKFVRTGPSNEEFLTSILPSLIQEGTPITDLELKDKYLLGKPTDPTHQVEVSLALVAPGHRIENAMRMRFRVNVRQ